MYTSLERWSFSPNVVANLAGLLTDAEIAEALPLLEAGGRGFSGGDEQDVR